MDNIIIWIVIIIIIIINLIIIIYISLFDTGYGKDFLDSNLTKVDTLYHVTATKQNLLGYLNLIDVSNYDFISLTNLSSKTPQFNYVSGRTDKLSMYYKLNANSDINTINYTSDNKQILQGYSELKYSNCYQGISLKHSIPVSAYNMIYNNDKQYIQAFSRDYIRLTDKVPYTFYQININSPDTTNYNDLQGLVEDIRNRNPDTNKIIVGNFGIHGHEKVFKSLGKDYLICPMYKTITVNNSNDGVSSYDGLIVSTKLYKTIKYKIDFSKSDIDRYVLTARLYQTGFGSVEDVSDYKFKNYVTLLKNNTVMKNININNEGSYDSTKTQSTKYDITTNLPTRSDNYIIYSNEIFNQKINTIEIMNNSNTGGSNTGGSNTGGSNTGGSNTGSNGKTDNNAPTNAANGKNSR